MGQKVLVDTDILLKSYRGDKNKFLQLKLIKDNFSISVITAFEILNGAKNINQLASLRKEFKSYPIIHLNNEISIEALQLYSKYTVRKQIRVADLLIAATALHYKLQLYTDNKKDYNFIKGLSFYEERV